MTELLAVIGATIVVAGVIALAARWLEPALRWLENSLTFCATSLIVLSMCYVCAEVVMRYVFDSPIPGHLEGSELLVPIIVFFAVSYTQARNGHVGMTLIVESLPPKWQIRLDLFTLGLSILVCSVLAWFGMKYSYQLWQYDDVTMTPPYWKTWPSAAAIPLGYLMLALRMWLQALHVLNSEKFPAPPSEEIAELHAAE